MNPLVRLNWQVTLAFVVATIVTHVAADALDTAYAVLCVVAFVAGFGLFGLGFWNGVQRSRDEIVNLPGLLAASKDHVPARTRNLALGALATQVLTAVVAASVRPFTPQAFGLLVPLLGLGFNTLTGSRYGRFPDRPPNRPPTAKSR